MFGRKQRTPEPPSTAFAHSADCATPDAMPEWEQLDRHTWRRLCSCRTAHWSSPARRPAPPDPSVLRHACEFVPTPVWDQDAFWRVSCPACLVSVTVVPHRRAGDEPLPANAGFLPEGAS